MKLGIFGGSFNPPHKMHLEIALKLIEKEYVDKVIFVPTGDKYRKKDLINGYHRYNMIKEMIKGKNKLEVDNYEIKNGCKYTYETLDHFQNIYPNDIIYFVLGRDNIEQLDTWMKKDYLLEHYYFLMIDRGKKSSCKILKKYKNNNHLIETNIKTKDISSTEIRKCYQDSKENNYLEENVKKYIKRYKLYQKENNMKKIVEKLKETKKTIATMESCTGGFIVNEITNIEGSSDVLKFSCVTYSNEYKIKMGVSKDVIEKYSVYSSNTADEMAKSISLFANSDYGIGITGKLNRIDENNLTGKDNEVFVSIFDRKNDKYYRTNLEVHGKTRKENKVKVLEKIREILLEIL